MSDPQDTLMVLRTARRAIKGLLRVDRKASTTSVSGWEHDQAYKAARLALQGIDAIDQWTGSQKIECEIRGINCIVRVSAYGLPHSVQIHFSDGTLIDCTGDMLDWPEVHEAVCESNSE